MRKCDYCGELSSGEEKCPGCQSTDYDSKPVETIREGHPFLYKGYVVWWLQAAWRFDAAQYLFYLGDTLVEQFTVSREVLRAFVPEYETVMPFIWDLFLLAQGEEEVLRVVEQNTIKPATFEITRKSTVEEFETIGLSFNDLCAAMRRSPRTGGSLTEERLGLEHAVEFFKG